MLVTVPNFVALSQTVAYEHSLRKPHPKTAPSDPEVQSLSVGKYYLKIGIVILNQFGDRSILI